MLKFKHNTSDYARVTYNQTQNQNYRYTNHHSNREISNSKVYNLTDNTHLHKNIIDSFHPRQSKLNTSHHQSITDNYGVKLPSNQRLLVVRRPHKPKNRFIRKNLEFGLNKSHQELDYNNIHKNYGNQVLKINDQVYSGNPSLFDPKAELKARIIKAILSSNETLEREQAYKRDYEKQLASEKFRRSSEAQLHSRSSQFSDSKKNDSKKKDSKKKETSKKNSQILRQFYPYREQEQKQIRSNRGKKQNKLTYHSFKPGQDHKEPQNQEYLLKNDNLESEDKKCRTGSQVYPHRMQKQRIHRQENRQRNNSAYADLKIFFKDLSGSLKTKEVEEIKPWVIKDQDRDNLSKQQDSKERPSPQ